MAVRFTILGSGSSGNCAYLEAGETRLLIDAGFSARQIRERLASIGRAPEGLSGILVTHEHGDHIQGLGTLCGRLDVPLFANRLTREAITRQFPQTRFRFVTFETGAEFALGTVTVQTFSVPHDAVDPVGFVLATAAGRLGFLTDLGHVTKLILERVKLARVLVLEANHDLRLLQEDSRRPWSTKQRILSRHGHLSNDAAAEVAEHLVGGELREIFLGHLSRDCNRPELALRAVSDRLAKTGAQHVKVHNTSQDAPSPTVEMIPPRVESADGQLLWANLFEGSGQVLARLPIGTPTTPPERRGSPNSRSASP
ncbi:MAG TPA: MBL fold metallo-hydrolase [Verrucomicrobiota bacterium]|nr:MBL fold metallo-hydrolase [Verrucomicrobiota bacterium]